MPSAILRRTLARWCDVILRVTSKARTADSMATSTSSRSASDTTASTLRS
jgi:hypothetical protein